MKEAYIKNIWNRPTKGTYEIDLCKNPLKETYERDLHKNLLPSCEPSCENVEDCVKRDPHAWCTKVDNWQTIDRHLFSPWNSGFRVRVWMCMQKGACTKDDVIPFPEHTEDRLEFLSTRKSWECNVIWKETHTHEKRPIKGGPTALLSWECIFI